jgi:prephenate dehydrogenase
MGLVDTGHDSPSAAVEHADLVVLATPVSAMDGLLGEIAPHLAPGATVTDVGSVKSPVVHSADRRLPSAIPFVGGHPMAGSEQGGVARADLFLFENATYVLCPPAGMREETFKERFADLIDMVELTGARILLLAPERHDRIAAAVSHLPQLVAVSLMTMASKSETSDGAFLRLAAGGFRDMTRIAASSFELWDDILTSNKVYVAEALTALIESLTEQRNRLEAGEMGYFLEAFRLAGTARRAIPRDMKGFLHPLSDAYVYGEDRPGFLFHLTKVLFEAGLNIKDIELLKMREGSGGAFRLGFSTDEDANAAVAMLNAGGYTAYRL